MIWYSHWDTGSTLKNMEIGLATLRRDGFAYLSRKVPDSPAHVVTTTFEAGDGDPIFANVEGVTEAAPLKVELLDDFDQPVPGFSGEDAGTVAVSGTRVAVEFPKGAIPAVRPLALKVTLPEGADAKLYALYIGTE